MEGKLLERERWGKERGSAPLAHAAQASGEAAAARRGGGRRRGLCPKKSTRQKESCEKGGERGGGNSEISSFCSSHPPGEGLAGGCMYCG